MQDAEASSGFCMCFLSVAKLSGSRERQPSLHRLPPRLTAELLCTAPPESGLVQIILKRGELVID
jgi:hypothetical protein